MGSDSAAQTRVCWHVCERWLCWRWGGDAFSGSRLKVCAVMAASDYAELLSTWCGSTSASAKASLTAAYTRTHAYFAAYILIDAWTQNKAMTVHGNVRSCASTSCVRMLHSSKYVTHQTLVTNLQDV